MKRRMGAYEQRRTKISGQIVSIQFGHLCAADSRTDARRLLQLEWLTGCRQDELVQLTWRAFNPKAGTLDVTGKGNKRRTIELSGEATAHISAQPRTLGSDLIFCRDTGEAFAEAASDYTHFRRKLDGKREGFRRFRFHDLRHLYAVEALRGGRSIYDLSQHLGHTSVKTTEIYLAFLTPAEAQRAKAGMAQNQAQPRRSMEAAIEVST